MNTFTEIEDWIRNALNELAANYFKQYDKTSTFCTSSIKEIIGNYGIKEEYSVCASGFPDHFEQEWLYDMVWYKVEKDTGNIVSVELVLESEMTYGLKHIKFDFEKLLLANSNHRIMICCAGKTPIEEITNYCDKAVQGFEQLKKGDRVFTLIWDDYGSGEFIPHLSIKNHYV